MRKVFVDSQVNFSFILHIFLLEIFCQMCIIYVRAACLQPISVNTVFDLAKVISEKAYQSDSPMCLTYCFQSNQWGA